MQTFELKRKQPNPNPNLDLDSAVYVLPKKLHSLDFESKPVTDRIELFMLLTDFMILTKNVFFFW